jgi:hypothetical protein
MAVIDAAIAVGTFVGADALGAGAAAAAGGALMGAGAGALYSGITGDGNILNSALNGALIGGTLGFGGEALGLGSTASGATTGVGGALAPTGGAAVAGGAAPVATSGTAAGTDIFSGLAGTTGGNALPAATTLPDVSSAALNAGDVEAQAGGFYGGQAPANPYASMSDSQLGKIIDTSTTSPDFWGSGMGTATKWGAGLLAANAILGADKKKYGTLSQDQIVSKPLPYQSNFGTYQPLDTTVMRPMGPAVGYSGTSYGTPGYVGSRVGYADGGITNSDNGATPPPMPPGGPVEQMSRDNALGQNQMFPQSQLQTNAFSSPTNTPMGSNMIAAAGDVNVDPYTGAEKFAAGGIMQSYAQGGVPSLGSYAAGGNPRLLKGPGDGMSDNIPAVIGQKQPARLADGEFVVPADVVSHLGNGSTDAGAEKLHSMMDKVRKARTGRKAQGKQIKADKFVPK